MEDDAETSQDILVVSQLELDHDYAESVVDMRIMGHRRSSVVVDVDADSGPIERLCQRETVCL